MNAIVSYLPKAEEKWIQQIWMEVATQFQLPAHQKDFRPQLIYQISKGYEVKGLQQTLERIIPQQESFFVHCCGVGYTEGRNPHLFIPVVKSYPLIHIQQTIWDETKSIRMGTCPTYQPDGWTPRIYFPYIRENTERLLDLYVELRKKLTHGYIPIEQVSWISTSYEGEKKWRHYSLSS